MLVWKGCHWDARHAHCIPDVAYPRAASSDGSQEEQTAGAQSSAMGNTALQTKHYIASHS